MEYVPKEDLRTAISDIMNKMGECNDMQKEIQIKKDKLLNRMSKKKYVRLLKFIENVYLAEYDLKILMARKFSNLFFALLPLVLRENGNRVINIFNKKYNGRSKPTIISHRALSMIKQDIQSGKYKRILLVDDIIIRGRSMTGIYELLKSWFEEAGITDYEIAAYAYAENRERNKKNEEFEKIKKVEKICSVSEWREISDEIVDIFYLFGTAYTSYVPNSRIDTYSELGHRIAQHLDGKDLNFFDQTSAEMAPYAIKAYVYTPQCDSEAVLSTSIRIYEYQELQQYILVPMVMLKPINEDVLMKYLDAVSELMPIESFERLRMIKDDDIVYRAVVYIVSALWGWKFVNEYLGFGCNELMYETEEENINFCMPLLKEKEHLTFNRLAMDSLWQDLWRYYEESPDIEEAYFLKEEDINDLNRLLGDSIKEIDERGYSKNCVRQLLGKYLYLNGILDEERISQSKSESKDRLLGYPLVMLKSKLDKYGDDWVRALLYAIDFGKGSILSSVMRIGGKNYFVSMLHEGEQNYKYLENTYFSFLYGLYRIEYISRKQRNEGRIADRKKKFVDAMVQYRKENELFYLNDDIRRMEEMCVGENYENVLLNDVWYYINNDDLKKAISIANQIVTAEENHGSELQ